MIASQPTKGHRQRILRQHGADVAGQDWPGVPSHAPDRAPWALLGAGAGVEFIVGREGCHAEGEAGEVDAARVDDDGSRPVPGGFGL